MSIRVDSRYLVSLCDSYVMPLLKAAEDKVPEEQLYTAGPEAIAARTYAAQPAFVANTSQTHPF